MKTKLTPTLLLMALTLQSCSSSKTKVSEEPVALEPTEEVILSLPDPVLETPKAVEVAPPAIPFRGYNKFSAETKYSLPPRYENFDKKPYPTDAFVIANMIAIVQPELDEETRDIIATKLSLAIKKYNIEPQIFVSIIDTETNFKTGKISSTGDLSIAQINVDVWNREFERMNLPLIDKDRVQVDLEYAFTKMADILNIIKIRHEKSDPKWYARYHSGTPKFKNDYLRKLEIRMKLMAASETLNNQMAQVKNIEILAATKTASPAEKKIQANNFIQAILTPIPMATPDPQYTAIEKRSQSVTEFATNILQHIMRF